MTAKNIRVRIAPSPTGDPHVGLAYVTLFNYVLAKKSQGQLVLRIEDTDQTRAKASSEENIMKALRWLGLNWDEGPDIGGPFGPYRQSERTAIYKKHVDELLAKKKAYRCFCTADRLAALREKQKQEKQNPKYDGFCRDLPEAEINERLKEGVPHVVRLVVPQEGVASFVDQLRGKVEIACSQIDDQVLLKSDGFPTYHLANVVDDHLMQITHVMRAEEWISSTPKHVLLYEAFGWEMPEFIHLPLLRNKDKSKISKRKNPVSLNYYKKRGILPKTMLNFLALMGWSLDGKTEKFTLQEMLAQFSLSDMHLGSPVFDLVKLDWLNGQYIKEMQQNDFVSYLRSFVFSEEYLGQIYPLLRERLDSFEQFTDKASFFFNGALSYEGLPLLPETKKAEDMIKMLSVLIEKIEEVSHWNAEKIKEALDQCMQETGWKSKEFFMPIRLIVTGRKDSPPLFETIEVLGREIVRYRLWDAQAFLRKG